MTVFELLGVLVTILVPTLFVAAWLMARRRRRRLRPPGTIGWLTDDMVRDIIETGTLDGPGVPEEDLDLDEIAREEERFWSETWDEPGPYWE